MSLRFALCLIALTVSGFGCRRAAAPTAEHPSPGAVGPQEVAWGPTVNELQAGLSAKQRRFEAGKTMEISMHLRTTGDKELHLFGFTRFQEYTYCHNAALTFTSRDSRKKCKPILSPFNGPVGHENVRRGEVLVAKWILNPADMCWAFLDEMDDPFRPLPPGTYEVAVEYAYSEKEKKGSLDYWKGAVTSGTVRIEIVAPGPVSPAKPPATTAERVARLQAEIDEIEAHCVPARGTPRPDVEKRFGAGKPATNHKIPPPGGVPEDSPFRSYAFCDNGVLFVGYDERWQVLWAHFLDPYSVKGRPDMGHVGDRPTPEERLRELEPRLRQMKAIKQEYDRRFPEASRSSAPPPPPIRGAETAK